MRVGRNFHGIRPMNRGYGDLRTLADFKMRIIPEFLLKKEARSPVLKDFNARILVFH